MAREDADTEEAAEGESEPESDMHTDAWLLGDVELLCPRLAVRVMLASSCSCADMIAICSDSECSSAGAAGIEATDEVAVTGPRAGDSDDDGEKEEGEEGEEEKGAGADPSAVDGVDATAAGMGCRGEVGVGSSTASCCSCWHCMLSRCATTACMASHMIASSMAVMMSPCGSCPSSVATRRT